MNELINEWKNEWMIYEAYHNISKQMLNFN